MPPGCALQGTGFVQCTRSALSDHAICQRCAPAVAVALLTKLNSMCHRPAAHTSAWSLAASRGYDRTGFRSFDHETVGPGPPGTTQAWSAPVSTVRAAAG